MEDPNTRREVLEDIKFIHRYRMRPCSLMAYLKLQSLIKTNAKKSHILIALKSLYRHLVLAIYTGAALESMLLWSVARSLQIKLRVF